MRSRSAPSTSPASLPTIWVRVEVRASALNHHDLWSLRGIGLAPDQLPMVLGCDAAGDRTGRRRGHRARRHRRSVRR